MSRPVDLARARTRLAETLGTTEVALDRLAAALALDSGVGSGRQLEPADGRVDAFDEGPVFSLLGAGPEASSFGSSLATGYERLLARVAEADDDPVAAVAALIRAVRVGSAARGESSGSVTIPVGVHLGRQILFTLNQESGRQTNGNTRITGEPGMGKSQFLLHLLAGFAVRAPEAGFLLLDYKGDLSKDREFAEATRATVVRPEREAVPINPFEVPASLERRLVPSSIARIVASVGQGIGEVQLKLLRDGIGTAYEDAAPQAPTTREIADAVETVYALQGRSTDSVTALLELLAGLGLFATSTRVRFEDFLRGRWIIDLSGLQDLRELVAFVLVGWLARNVQSLDDSAPLDGGRVRQLRHVVAIDEAHHYVRRRCQPLLELVREGRGKGVPVVLSSQSLSDFQGFTELAELMQNDFVLRHGRAPDARTAQGALRLPADLARRAGDAITSVEQFCALTGIDPELQLQPVQLHGFFAGQWRK